MSAVDSAAIGKAVARCQDRMSTLEQELNEADARLGDGDTGVMLSRVVTTLASIDYASESDVGNLLSLMARKTASATGSSLGTLLSTALMTISRRTKGSTRLEWADLGGYIDAAVEAMIARGGANLGDKTVLDILHAVAGAVSGLSGADMVAQAARRAAASTLETFRNKPNRVGRARMFADRSMGMDDPGMLAVYHLLHAVAAADATLPEAP
jgi:dihydroxyacetone kinase